LPSDEVEKVQLELNWNSNQSAAERLDHVARYETKIKLIGFRFAYAWSGKNEEVRF
jgi:hypothetical protein